MDVYALDPLQDPRWMEFVGRQPKASVFHTPGWLRALQRTYRFQPLAWTTSPPAAELTNGLVFCTVRSWLTGYRLVSLPFSDHCEPLVDGAEELRALCRWAQRQQAQKGWRYVELRPASPEVVLEEGFGRTQSFYLHRLDLRPALESLLRGFHKDSVQRRIRKAERAGLTYEEGRSEPLLRKLYHLLEITRRRHGAPPQPWAWFRNLIDCLGKDLCIRVVSSDGRPAAGILTLTHGTKVVYKYGGSDPRLNHLGGMPLLFWKAIQDAKQRGAHELDLGRSDCDNAGLVVFKERWSAKRSPLTYWRFPGDAHPTSGDGWKMRAARRLFNGLPGGVRRAIGRFIYRHIA